MRTEIPYTGKCLIAPSLCFDGVLDQAAWLKKLETNLKIDVSTGMGDRLRTPEDADSILTFCTDFVIMIINYPNDFV